MAKGVSGNNPLRYLHVFRANEVLAIGNVGRDGELHRLLSVCTPVTLVARASRAVETALPDFEPVAAAVVGADIATISLIEPLANPELLYCRAISGSPSSYR